MDIGTIVVAMMENRSFDHLLGFLKLEGRDVDGLRSDPAWQASIASTYKGVRYPPLPMPSPYDRIEADPPHGRGDIKTQLGARTGGRYAMDGFVESYSHAKGAPPIGPAGHPPVMGYFDGDQAPVCRFFAEKFAVCDH